MDNPSSPKFVDRTFKLVETGEFYCDPCQYASKLELTNATLFCSECEENLCGRCADEHGIRKATKSHKLRPINEKSEFVKYCKPCELEGKQQKAALHCKECEEFLCNNCVNMHKARKATQNHSPKHFDFEGNPSIKTKEKTRTCEICPSEEAKRFCKDCKQFFCDQCSSTHANGKETKSHKLTDDFVIGVSQNVRHECQPCSGQSKVHEAIKFCQDCTEWLCETCARVHSSQKISRSHQLKDADDINYESDICEICIKDNKVFSAREHCKECQELLCDNCVLVHKKQKATKHHTILEGSYTFVENDKNDKEVNMVLCAFCEDKSIAKEATYYCNDCECCLCGECKKQHFRQRNTKRHNVVDLSSVPIEEYIDIFCCDLCTSTQSAEYFCTYCTVYLCSACKGLHQAKKNTKSHTIVAAKDVPTVDHVRHCSHCAIEYNESIPAIKFCKDCLEYLCERCCSVHNRIKETRGHLLTNVDDVQNEHSLCLTCLDSMNKEVHADGFCADCENFYCSKCISRHKAAKMSRNHNFLTVKEGELRTLGGNVLLCDLCKFLNKSTKASAFCKECKELLCDFCYKQHPAQKNNRGHQLVTDLSQYEEFIAQFQKIELTEKEGSGQMKTEIIGSESLMLMDTPGKPWADEIRANTVILVWDRPKIFDDRTDYYQISYKENGQVKWTFYPCESDLTTATKEVTDLKPNTEYIFRVRVVHQNGEGLYSEESEIIKTVNSPAANLLKSSKIVTSGKPSPSVYGVPAREIPNTRDTQNKTKKLEVGERSRRPNNTEEKTIMLVGATGTGKSTLVDGLVNYALGVSWNDKFRFTIIDLEAEEQAKRSDESVSQTEWITVYTVHPEKGGRLDYTLNIIDTPGFGDTRGLDRDQQIIEQIRALFSGADKKGVQCIDAICFLIKAPDARLTATQNYIFQQIMALFGKDVEENICSLITFADGQDPPVLAALEASKLPFGKHFTFNNSGLFAKNKDLENTGLAPMFWDMGMKSFQHFFRHLAAMHTKSLQLTKSVLDERKKLETTIQNLQPQVDAGLAKLNMLNDEKRIISQHKLDADSNKNFEYEVDEIHQKRHELPKGQHTTNCLHCNYTCHKNCAYANDDEKKNCCAMDSSGNCTQCPDKCIWSQHANTPYVFEYITEKKKKTYAEKLQKYQDAEGKRLTHEQVVSRMEDEIADLWQDIEVLMVTVKECNERLGEIALRPNPLSMIDYIDCMIKSEQMEQKAGCKQRIAMLEDMKHKASTTTRAENLFSQIKQHSTSSTPGDSQAKPGTNRLKKFLNNFIPWK